VIVDSHCHLNYLERPDECLAAARRRQVGAFLCIGVDEARHREALTLADAHHDVWATVGQHPEGVSSPPALGWIEAAARHAKVVGIGETGLDYFRLGDDAAELRRFQQEAFATQLEIASRLGLPVVVHTRAAESDTLAAIRQRPDVIGVLHCFTESWALAKAAIDLGYYVSISGIVTFRNAANVREVAVRVPRDRLLVETDCPWLAPEPHRGRTNEPAFVVDTARFIARLRGTSYESLAAETTENFYRLFARARSVGGTSRSADGMPTAGGGR
jgi:TatD DNase family protein